MIYESFLQCVSTILGRYLFIALPGLYLQSCQQPPGHVYRLCRSVALRDHLIKEKALVPKSPFWLMSVILTGCTGSSMILATGAGCATLTRPPLRTLRTRPLRGLRALTTLGAST